jgi:hypothetical protein
MLRCVPRASRSRYVDTTVLIDTSNPRVRPPRELFRRCLLTPQGVQTENYASSVGAGNLFWSDENDKRADN